jgi:hypothetical protein
LRPELKDKIVGLICAAISVYLVCIIIWGLIFSEVVDISKHSEEMILRSRQPLYYWFNMGLYSFLAVMLIKTTLKKLSPRQNS